MTSTGTDARNNTFANGVLEAGGGRLWLLTEARSQREQRGGRQWQHKQETNFVCKDSGALQKAMQAALIIPQTCGKPLSGSFNGYSSPYI